MLLGPVMLLLAVPAKRMMLLDRHKAKGAEMEDLS
jgi:hypothetical protein